MMENNIFPFPQTWLTLEDAISFVGDMGLVMPFYFFRPTDLKLKCYKYFRVAGPVVLGDAIKS